MRKVVVHGPGSYNELAIEEHPDPVPGPGEVLVQTTAVGVNYADVIVRMGLYRSARDYVGWPITPGFEFAGRVRSAGAGVLLRADQPVFGVTRFGAYTTHLCVPESQVFVVPPELSMVQAAGFPTVFLTAWYGLCELLRVRQGMQVLVHSAAGGVGGALVQIARALGCHVVGVVGRSDKAALASELGAHAVIDKQRDDLWTSAARHAPEGYDIVFDANGVATLRGSYACLRPTGKLVVYGFHSMLPRTGGKPNWPRLALDFLRTPRFSPLALTNDNKSILAFNLSYLFDRRDLLAEGMRGLLDWLAAGRLRALPVREMPLGRVADAHRAIESGTTTGKLVLIP